MLTRVIICLGLATGGSALPAVLASGLPDPALAGSAQPVKAADPAGGPAVDISLCGDGNFHREVVLKGGTDDRGRAALVAGSTFAVELVRELDARAASVGDPVEARLVSDLKVAGRTIAARGALVTGRVTEVIQPRNQLRAEFSVHRWLHASAVLGVAFENILTESDETVPISARPAPSSRVLSATGADTLIVVNKEGLLEGAMGPTAKGDAISLAITGACLPAGPFGLAIAPIANALVGAVKPEYELKRGVQPDEKHPRVKGFADGLVNGLPGAFIIGGAARKGDSVDCLPGYKILVELESTLADPEAG